MVHNPAQELFSIGSNAHPKIEILWYYKMLERIEKFGPSWLHNRKQNLIIPSNKKVIAI